MGSCEFIFQPGSQICVNSLNSCEALLLSLRDKSDVWARFPVVSLRYAALNHRLIA